MRQAGIVTMLVLAVASLAWAQEPTGGQPAAGGGGEPRDRMGSGRMGMQRFDMADMLLRNQKTADELKLTDDQKTKLKDASVQFKTQLIDLNAELDKSAVKQAEMMLEDTPDEAAILKGVDEASAVRAKIARVQAQQLLTIHKLLTPEQRTKLREISDQRMKDRAAGRGSRDNRGEAPPPPPAPAATPAPAPAPAATAPVATPAPAP